MKFRCFWNFIFFAGILTGCTSSDILIQSVGPEGRISYGENISVSETSSGAQNLLANLLLQDDFLNDPEAALSRLIDLGKSTDTERLPLAIAELSLTSALEHQDIRA